MMKEGGKATLTIPAALAYGSRQMNDIPPNSELIFEIELIKVGGGKAGGFDISELIPGDYLARSFASASVDKKNAALLGSVSREIHMRETHRECKPLRSCKPKIVKSR